MTQAFNLSQFANNVNTSGQASLTAAVSGTLPVANGGTGATSLTANNVLLGNGTNALQAVAPSTSGNVLTSNGTTWTSATAPISTGALIGYNVYTTTGANTYTKATNNPSFIIVELVGGGGGSSVNAGGNGGTGGTSSFGALVTATGGVGGSTMTGGSGTLGDLNLSGGNGQAAFPATSTQGYVQGATAPLYCAAGGIGLTMGVTQSASLQFAPILYGGGAGLANPGGTTVMRSGGAGGYAMKKILASELAASVTVTVGAGGTAGTSGTAGAQGLAIVWEYK